MKLIVRISFGMGIAVLVLWLLTDREPGAVAQRPLASASQTPSVPPSDREPTADTISGPVPPSASAKKEAPTVNLKSYIISQHPAAIESRLEKRDPFLGRYRLLAQKKVLLTKDETKELKVLLEDGEKRTFYRSYLESVDFSTHAAADEQMYRLFALQYLESAWRSQKEPELLEYFVEFVLQDNFYADLSVASKKTLAYEKMKVLDFLKQESPASLDIIKQRMQGLRHEKLLRNYFEQLS